VIGVCAGSFYHKVLFAAVVAVVFALYALMFNGRVYALTTSYPTFSNSTWTMRFLFFIPPSRQPSPCQTTGDQELWYGTLRLPGN
jgi:hypothetical protein